MQTNTDRSYKTVSKTTKAKRSSKILVPEAEKAMRSLKHSVASDFGIDFTIEDKGNLSSKQCGKVGGEMVRRIIEQAKRDMFTKYPNNKIQ